MKIPDRYRFGSPYRVLIKSILPMALVFSLSSPSSGARKNSEVAKPSQPASKTPKDPAEIEKKAGDDAGDSSKRSKEDAQDCSQTFLLQGPVRGMIYK
ncbi:MAG: hypothetical protein WCH11_04135, partial [Bdellovibrio sp.]